MIILGSIYDENILQPIPICMVSTTYGSTTMGLCTRRNGSNQNNSNDITCTSYKKEITIRTKSKHLWVVEDYTL